MGKVDGVRFEARREREVRGARGTIESRAGRRLLPPLPGPRSATGRRTAAGPNDRPIDLSASTSPRKISENSLDFFGGKLVT